MKISYRNYPILEKLQKGDLGIIPTLRTDNLFYQVEPIFKQHWEDSKVAFKKEVYKISKTFSDASNKAYSKLYPLFVDIVEGGIGFSCKGTFMYGDWVHMIDYDHPNTEHHNKENKISIFVFLKTGEPVLYFREQGSSLKGWVSQEVINGHLFGVPITTKDQISALSHSAVVRCVLFEMFKAFAEVETKTIPPNSKVKDINDKYVNDTKLKLTYLDSKWFTNLIKSDAFKVSGHFRLQPKKKDGEWTKELIWISEFEKTGYTAPARILAHNEGNNSL